jgi:hypothetical protein
VAGFLVNMVERTLMLVSPCRASARYPKGYKVYATETFETAEELERACRRIIREQMPWHVEPDQRMAFRSDLTYVALDDGLRVENEHGSTTLAGQPFIRELGALIHEGTHTGDEVQELLLAQGADFFTVQQALQDLLDAGVLVERIDDAALPAQGETAHA